MSNRIYDLAGRLGHEKYMDGSPSTGINVKQAHEYAWETSGVVSGTYLYVIKANHARNTVRTLKKVAVVK